MTKTTLFLLAFLFLLVSACQSQPSEPSATSVPATEPPPTEAPTQEADVAPTDVAPTDVVATDEAEAEPTLEEADPMADDAPPDLAALLGNLTYTGVLLNEPITLLDGTATYDDGGDVMPFVSLVADQIATGDLNGDGVDDAAGFVVNSTTGTGRFVYLVAVLGVETDATPVEAVLIGDRSPVEAVSIEEGQVLVEFVTQSDEDPLCCPSLRMRKGFTVADGRLVESYAEELGTISEATP